MRNYGDGHRGFAKCAHGSNAGTRRPASTCCATLYAPSTLAGVDKCAGIFESLKIQGGVSLLGVTIAYATPPQNERWIMSLTREEWLRRGVILGLIVLVCVGIVWAESKVHHGPPPSVSKIASPPTQKPQSEPQEVTNVTVRGKEIIVNVTTADEAFNVLHKSDEISRTNSGFWRRYGCTLL